MKSRIFALILLALSTVFAGFAQVCVISDADDTVEVFECNLVDNNKVVVTLSNDSNDINANITVEVEVQYGGLRKKTYTGHGKVEANKSADITITIDPKISGYEPISAKVTSITGSKCKTN